MERWRSFFNRAGEDIWTIIEQAINLAATDYPSQFREKRCDIAEALFARRPQQSDTDATGLSTASVVSDCMNHTQGPDDTRGDRAGTRSKEDMDVKDQAVDNTNPNHLTFYCDALRKDVRRNDLLVAAAVSNIHKTLNDPAQTDATILHTLQTLESVPISVDVLKATEIGKQVNNLRRHTCKDVRLIAKGLVRHWKELVDAWVINNAENSPVDPPAGHATTDAGMEGGSMISVTFDEAIYSMHGEFPERRESTSRAELSGGPNHQGSLKGKEDHKSNLGPEISKRKACNETQVVQHAKKQHVAQGTISKAMPWGGPARSKVAVPCFSSQRSYRN